MPELDVKKSFTITYPLLFHGALMHVVDPKHIFKVFANEPITLAQGNPWPLHVGFSPSCVKTFDLSGHGDIIYDCSCSWPHGHIFFECDDGSALIPVPIASQAMIKHILEKLKLNSISTFSSEESDEISRILSAITVNLLPEELTWDEQQLLTTVAEKKDWPRFLGWFS